MDSIFNQNFVNFKALFKKVKPQICLDIGAHVGHFTQEIIDSFPDCRCLMLEANPSCRSYLMKIGQPFEIVALSKQRGESLFYVENSNPIATGASLFRENTQFYSPENSHTLRVALSTLDLLNPFPNSLIDLIKIDTQGSELDILKGGTQTLTRCRFLLLEVSLAPYNLEAPLMDEVLSWTAEHNFEICDILDYHRLVNNQIFQLDVLLINTSPFLKV